MRNDPRHVYVVSFDTANTDLKYFCSHSDQVLDGVAAADIFYGDIVNASTYSQSLNPIRANATIGGINFTFMDTDGGLSSLLNSKLLAGDGLRAKRVQHWVSEVGAEWSSDYDLIQTQQIHDSIKITNDGLGYQFTGRDIQRSELENIFEPKKTNTTAALTKTSITVNVSSTTGIDLIQHGASYSDAPNAEVLYFHIKDEIVRGTAKSSNTFTVDNAQSTLNGAVAKDAVSAVVTDASGFDTSGVGYIDNGAGTLLEIKWTGKSTNTLTGVTGVTAAQTSGWTIVAANGRGALGTVPAAYGYDSGAADRVKVTEHIYYELPAIKLAYAILTGTLYGSSDTIPDHHNLGISTDWISTSEFTQFSDDIWDASDDTAGIILRFSGLKKTNAKKFIEEELLFWCGVFNPILNTGELGLRRMTGVISDAAYTGILNEDNVLKVTGARFDLNDVHNNVSIDWNWNPITEEYTRHTEIVDTDSQGEWGASKTLELKSKGLHGSIHTDAVLSSMFNMWRDRHVSPPFKATLVLDYSQRNIKVGEIKRLQLDHLPQFTDEDGNYSAFDASVEVQKVTLNPTAGTVTVSVFGSTKKAVPLALGSDASPIADSWFTSEGSDISGVTTGTLSGGGTIWTIDGASSLVGSDNLSSSEATTDNDKGIFYWDGDLNISELVNITKNIELRVNGFITGNADCKIDGKGAGLVATTNGQAGVIGNTQPGGALYTSTFDSADMPIVEGKYSKIPIFVLDNDSGTSINGKPTDLQGSSGGDGGDIFFIKIGPPETQGGATTQGATAVGNGGAGLVIYCKGASGVAGSEIDLSGDDGDPGLSGLFNFSGASAGGAAGGLAMFLIGNTVTETLTDYFTAINGNTPISGNPLPSENSTESARINPYASFFTGLAALNVSRANLLVDWVPDDIAATEDAAPLADTGTLITFTENSNTPQTPAENLATIDITITAPSDTSYSHSMIAYKLASDADAQFQRLPYPAKNETTVVLAMDGSEYTFRAYPVNVDGMESAEFIQKNFTVSTSTGLVVLASGNSVKTDTDVPSNGGVQLDANGIDLYDGSGNKIFDANANNGELIVGIVANEKYFKFDPTTGNLTLGRNAQLTGADAYNNDSVYTKSTLQEHEVVGYTATGGVITYNNDRSTNLQTTTIQNSEAEISITGQPFGFVDYTFAKNRRFKIMLKATIVSANAGREIYMTTGDPAFGTSPDESNAFGFKMTTANELIGLVVSDGVTYTTSTSPAFAIVTNNTTYKLEAILDVTTSPKTVKFYIDGTLKGTIENAPKEWYLHAKRELITNIKTIDNPGTGTFIVTLADFRITQDV